MGLGAWVRGLPTAGLGPSRATASIPSQRVSPLCSDDRLHKEVQGHAPAPYPPRPIWQDRFVLLQLLSNMAAGHRSPGGNGWAMPVAIPPRRKPLPSCAPTYTCTIYVHTDIQTDRHSCIHTYIQTYIHTDKHTHTHTYIYNTYIHTHTHTYIHTYVHTYVHTHTHTRHTM